MGGGGAPRGGKQAGRREASGQERAEHGDDSHFGPSSRARTDRAAGEAGGRRDATAEGSMPSVPPGGWRGHTHREADRLEEVEGREDVVGRVRAVVVVGVRLSREADKHGKEREHHLRHHHDGAEEDADRERRAVLRGRRPGGDEARRRRRERERGRTEPRETRRLAFLASAARARAPLV